MQGALLIPFGRITDLVGRKFSMVVGSSIMLVSVFALALSHSRWQFFVAMALGGAAGAFLSSAPSAVIGDVTGGRRAGPLLAGFQMMSDLGGITGPLLAGFLADAFSNSAAFLVGGCFLVIPLLASIRMRETKGLPAPEL
jgi:MFS family permease